MDQTQFAELLDALLRINETLSQEPESNFLTVANVAAVISLLVAFAVLAVSRSATSISRNSLEVAALQTTIAENEAKSAQKERDANFIISSGKDYNDLFSDLVTTRKLIDEHESLLEPFSKQIYDDSLFELSNGNPITEEEWRQVRNVKNFFKIRHSLFDFGAFSNEGLARSMDRYGPKTLEGIRSMEVLRFYWLRQGDFADGNITREEFASMYDGDFAWYDELQQFIDDNISVRIRD